jgi:hypothetical protein
MKYPKQTHELVFKPLELKNFDKPSKNIAKNRAQTAHTQSSRATTSSDMTKITRTN